jgi:epoxyqueuosine reductase
MIVSADAVKAKAREFGFNLVGLTPAQPSPTLAAYERWIAQGMHGKMGYMARPDRVARRQDLTQILPGAQTLIVVGLDYRVGIPENVLAQPSRGRIASYAWGLDYHEVLTPRLDQLAQWLRAEYRVYVDTGAILERSHAQQAGMGFIGKNTMLIHPRRGSYFVLGEIITDLPADVYDQPHRATMCGTCTRCLRACPTDAFPEPYVLDARRCISYHTIENKGWIDRHLRADFGNWVFGCDICQDVCPFQRFSTPTQEPALMPTADNAYERAAPHLSDLLTLDDATFKQRYQGTPIERVKRARLVRNACIAAGNSADPALIPYLIQLLYDESALVRGHAAWGLWRLMGDGADKLLTALYDRDDDGDVRAEIEALIG